MEYARTVIGYHGCSHKVAERILKGEPFVPTSDRTAWLGHGVYFWEYGPERAWEWAEMRCKRKGGRPAVVGAVIQLGACLDLLDVRNTSLLGEAAEMWTERWEKNGRKLYPALTGHALDCVAIDWLCDTSAGSEGLPFQTVRGAFFEGGPAYRIGEATSALTLKTHIQIAVRDPSCILGVFRPTRP